jgi:hypothetical protein
METIGEIKKIVKKACKISSEKASAIATLIRNQKVVGAVCEEPDDFEVLLKDIAFF